MVTSNVQSMIQEFVAQPQTQRWFTVYTCANHEKTVAKRLDARSVEHFLPIYTSVARWKDRRVKLDLPLFPGYLFVRLEAGERLHVLEVPGVVRLVGFNGQPYPVPDAEIESLRAGIQNDLRFVPHPYLNVGSRVRVKRGPLEGIEGILLRRKNVYRVVLSLHLIARSAAVEVDAADIERIP
jgi:transcription antitermination factor NusG